MAKTCPNCGHCIETAKRSAAVPSLTADTSGMSDSQMFAHYKAISHIGDVQFFIDVVQPSETTAAETAILNAARALLTEATAGRVKRADTLQQLRAIQIRWNKRYDRPPADYATFAVHFRRMERRAERREKRRMQHTATRARLADYLKRRGDRSVNREYRARVERLNRIEHYLELRARRPLNVAYRGRLAVAA